MILIQRLQIYFILVLFAGIAYTGLIIKLQKNEINEYKRIEKIEIKKQKITKQHVKKIQKINVPDNVDKFEQLLDEISVPE